MAFNTVTNLDFEDIKTSLKEYLRSSETFSDYNFEGSVLSQLLDVLSYNTYYSALNANLVANEVFFDSASIRENVVSLAKIVGYTPRSAKAAKALISLEIIVPPQIEALTLRKGQAFVGVNSNGSYIFSLLDDVTREAYLNSDGNRIVSFSEIEIYQGNLLSVSYVVDPTTKQHYVIPSASADTDLLVVSVNQNNTSAPLTYTRSTNITSLGPNDLVYFIQENKNEQFELIFGDGVFGRKLQNQEQIRIEYLINNQDEANDCREFQFTGTLAFNNSVITNVQPDITVNQPSSGGATPETISSIKYLAPRYYAAQNRAVTIKDYETLILQLYPNVESFSVFGGEDASPPQYGKVFIAAKPYGAETLTTTAKQELQKAIREYTILSVIPEVIDPSYLYLEIDSFVYYNNTTTKRTKQQLSELVRNIIVGFDADKDLNRFNGKFKYSKLIGMVDSTDPGITSNITRIRMQKHMKFLTNVFASYEVCYGNRISENTDLRSSGFKITGENSGYVYYFEKMGTNNIAIYRQNGSEKIYYSKNAGTIDYEKGEININAININSAVGGVNYIELSVIPKSNDIVALRDTYLSISQADVSVTAILDTIASASRTSGVGQIPVSS